MRGSKVAGAWDEVDFFRPLPTLFETIQLSNWAICLWGYENKVDRKGDERRPYGKEKHQNLSYTNNDRPSQAVPSRTNDNVSGTCRERAWAEIGAKWIMRQES
jgi:hypothetical protein